MKAQGSEHVQATSISAWVQHFHKVQGNIAAPRVLSPDESGSRKITFLQSV